LISRGRKAFKRGGIQQEEGGKIIMLDKAKGEKS
jgi:hypothetical protein